MLKFALLASALAAAEAHGSMSFPRPRNAIPGTMTADPSCIGQACFWYQVGCMIGCDECTGEGKYLYPPADFKPKGCTLVEPTNNARETRTWFGEDGEGGDFTKYNPWRYPGKAPVRDACGASSGYKTPGGGAYAPEVPKGFPVWSKGSEVLPATAPTVWKAGGKAEVAWSISAQHGGGYAYRLCPKGSDLSEACFQANPLNFVGDKHTIRYADGSAADFQINATSLSTGTIPAGSAWRRNPIPACNCDVGGGCSMGGKGYSKAHAYKPDPISQGACPTGTMFPAQFKDAAGLVGYLTNEPVNYAIVDEVKVPTKEGDYVLQWRWDCEETNQVWNSCADIRVSSTEPPTPYPAPVKPPAPGPTPPKPSGKGCKMYENPTCKGVSSGKCPFTGCKKCHDDTSWDCDECCDGCTMTHDPNKKVDYCAGSKPADPVEAKLAAFKKLLKIA